MDGSSREQKQALRERLLEKRAALSMEMRTEMDASITERVLSLPVYRKCDLLLTYVSVREEVDTRALICFALRDSKRVAVPRCEGKRMVFYRIDALEQLVPAKYGLMEPRPEQPVVETDTRTLCMVPGLSFDRTGARIGYGGGFYDRFLPGFRGEPVGLCYSSLLSESVLPVESHDCRVSMVVSDRKIWKLNGTL